MLYARTWQAGKRVCQCSVLVCINDDVLWSVDRTYECLNGRCCVYACVNPNPQYIHQAKHRWSDQVGAGLLDRQVPIGRQFFVLTKIKGPRPGTTRLPVAHDKICSVSYEAQEIWTRDRGNVTMGQSSSWPIDLHNEHVAPFPGPYFSPIPAQHRKRSWTIQLHPLKKKTILLQQQAQLVSSWCLPAPVWWHNRLLLPYMNTWPLFSWTSKSKKLLQYLSHRMFAARAWSIKCRRKKN